MSTDTIHVELSLAERHILTDLLRTFIHERVADAIKMAKNPVEMERGAEQARRLAQLETLVWEGEPTLPREDLDALRADLIEWAMETEETTREHDEMLADYDARCRPEGEPERKEGMGNLRQTIALDYAHKCVCEKIVSQIDAARELVAA
jgi:hypothetical protein